MQTLTEEVEFLSKANEGFLRDLKTKDFYSAYKQTLDELSRLREAHAVLISMIQNHHLSVGTSPSQTLTKNSKAQQSYKNQRYNRNCSTPNSTAMLRSSDGWHNNEMGQTIAVQDNQRDRSSSIKSFITCGAIGGAPLT